MAIQRLNLVAPSGGRVSVALAADAPVSSVAAGVRFAGGSFGTGFQIGPRGYHEFACTRVAPATTRDRFLVHGREVVVAEAVSGEFSVATMMGTYHELMTVYAGPAPERDRVFALFGSLRVTDHVGGMVVNPRSATLLDTMSEHIVVVVAGRGAMSIPGPRQAAALVPQYAGARTRHGEVWRVPTARSAPTGSVPTGPAPVTAYSYVLACAAGAAEVHFSDAATATGPELLAWLDDIDVAWHTDA